MKGITNIRVGNLRTNGREDYALGSAEWEQGGCRFHVGFDLKTKKIERGIGTNQRGGTIYKNPLHGVMRRDPGYFDTRKLDATAPKNVAILAYVFAEIARDCLIDIAIAKAEEKEAERLKVSAEAARIERMKEAGPQMFERLENAARVLASAHLKLQGATAVLISDEIRKIDELLDPLKGGA